MNFELPTTLSPALLLVRDLQRAGRHFDALSALRDLPPPASKGEDVLRNTYAAISARVCNEEADALRANHALESFDLDPEQIAATESDTAIDLAHYFFFTGSIHNAVKIAAEHTLKYPLDPFGHGRLGSYYTLLDTLDLAETHLKQATLLDPDRFEWHNNLGGVCLRQGKLPDAVAAYDRAMELNPDAPQPKLSRAKTLAALGETQQIVEQFRAEFDKDPTSIAARRALAKAYVLDEEPGRAVKLLAEVLIPIADVISTAPTGAESSNTETQFSYRADYEDQIAIRITLLEIFQEKQAMLKALAAVNQILQLEPKQEAIFLANRIQLLLDIGNTKLAQQHFYEAVTNESHAKNVAIRRMEAVLLSERGEYAAAEAIYRTLVADYPGDPRLQSELAHNLMWTGKLDEAREIFEEAARLNPYIMAQVINTGNLPSDPEAASKLQRFSRNYLLPTEARAAMSFASAKILEKNNRCEEAFEELHTANALVDKQIRWNNQRADEVVQKTQTVFSTAYLSALPAIRKTDRQPVFIIGMPRSGTTLLEQILSAHPDVYAAGEQPIMARFGRLLAKILKKQERYPFDLKDFTPELREHAARHYLWCISEFDDTCPVIVDKMPHNFMHVGLIKTIMPEAKIIYATRDPRDIAISNYQQNFAAARGGLGYAFNLRNIALEINRCYRMIEHWNAAMPGAILTTRYEDLIADQQTEMNRILDYLNLDWVPEMSEFYKVDRAVRTASVAQVRSGIYSTSTKKWLRYANGLDEFLNALDDSVLKAWED